MPGGDVHTPKTVWILAFAVLASGALMVFALGPARPHSGVALAALAAVTLGATVWALAIQLRGAIGERRAAAELQHLREALDELPCGLEIYDTGDRLVFANREMRELYPWIDFDVHIGSRFEDILRESIRQGRIPGAVGREEAWLTERLATRGREGGPRLQSLKGGRWINTYERRSRSNYVVGARMEVTDLVQKTRELEAGRERLQAVIGSAAVGIVTADARGVVVDANAAALALFGGGPDGVVGRSLGDLIPGLGTNGETPSLRRLEVDVPGAGSAMLRLDVSLSPVGDAAARQFVVVITDLTDRVRAERERAAMESRLREAERIESLGRLASGIAHDFNNVLGAMVANAALAHDQIESGAPSDAAASLTLIRRAGDRARKLVRQILAFGRREPVQRSPQALQDVVREALGILRATLPAQVTLDERLQPVPVVVAIDGVQIEHVVINLCTNAWQAMTDNRGRIEIGVESIDVSAQEAARLGLATGGHARLWVADDGVGMDESTRRRAFDPFFTTKPTGSGTGLGLSQVHGIVTSHQGAIDVSSHPGRGSRFDIYLPASSEPPVSLQEPNPAPPARGGEGRRVLYLDDDEVMPVVARGLLERAGYVVDCVVDPAQALAALRASPSLYDVLVTDQNMPGMSGLEVVCALAEQGGLPVATVLTSGLVNEELRAAAARLGVGAVMEKQYSLEQLVAAVERALDAQPLNGRAV